MAKIYYRYGAMDSSKTANMLMVAYNYEKQGCKVVCLKPAVDSRHDEGVIVSRLGIEKACITVDDGTDIFELVRASSNREKVHCVLVDECQFLSERHILDFVKIADGLDIPVICYGLKNSYKPGQIFPGSVALLYYADSIEEIKNVCVFCNRKATMNLRVVNGKPVYSGDLVRIGDTESSAEEHYLPVCRRHFFNPPVGDN